MPDFKKLAVWEKAHVLTLEVYRVSAAFPQREQYGLTDQMRRAALSIPANIAEGCGRESQAELARFLKIAKGSAFELEYHLLLAHDLEILDPLNYEKLEFGVTEVKRMLTSFIQRIASND